jgi:Cd2+/Zn2+-exporting ATPase
MGDQLDRLPDAIAHSQRTLRIIRQNVVASLAVKAVFVVLAPLGLATLVMAVVADMGMSLLVTLNALRLLRLQQSDGMPEPRQHRRAVAVPAG